jgi:nucleoside 2-deoxyribosyltransferase
MEASAMTLAYLATVYSKHPDGIGFAYKDACVLASRLILSGVNVFSPIAHSHGISLYGDIDAYDQRLWRDLDAAMVAKCDMLIVAHMEGWQHSSGIAHEIECFAAAGKPIFDLDPETLTMVRR